MHTFHLLAIVFLLSIISTAAYIGFSRSSTHIANGDEIIAICKKGEATDILCYQTQLESIAGRSGLPRAIQTLNILQQKEGRLRDCHTLAHKIAGYTVRQNPQEWQQLLQTTDPQACSSGFFHGILEGHLATDPNFTIDRNSIINICQGRATEYEQGSCAHGLGHLALVERLDNLDEALPVCQQAIKNIMQQCFSGIYMEHMVRTNLVDHGLAQTPVLNEEYGLQFSELCKKDREQLGKLACWGEMGYLYAGLASDQTTEVWSRCQEGREQTFIENCFLTGIQKVAVTSENDTAVTHACDPVITTPSLYNQCIGRIIDTAVTTSISFIPRALAVCGSQTEFSESCYTTLINTLKHNSQNVPANTCSSLPEKYQLPCQNSLATS